MDKKIKSEIIVFFDELSLIDVLIRIQNVQNLIIHTALEKSPCSTMKQFTIIGQPRHVNLTVDHPKIATE